MAVNSSRRATCERDRDKTAFVTCKGLWRFKVLSFGLANAPSQFARIMELVMSGLTYDVCLVYLDDILIFSKTLIVLLLSSVGLISML